MAANDPEEIVQAFYDGLVEMFSDRHVTVAEVLPRLVALIRAEQVLARRAERELCLAVCEGLYHGDACRSAIRALRD